MIFLILKKLKKVEKEFNLINLIFVKELILSFNDNNTISNLFLSIESRNLARVLSEPPTAGYGLYTYNFIFTNLSN